MIYVALGAFLGAIFRYAISNAFKNVSNFFPYATFIVNIIRMLFDWNSIKIDESEDGQFFAIIGFLGAFTTFSTFSLETMQLVQAKKYSMAIFYVLSSVIIGLFVTYIGITI